MDWEECCSKRIAKDVKPDEEMIKALIKSSRNKLESENRLALSDITATSKLSLCYDSLRELLEALALKEGYKIYNHDCYTAFLKEVMKESEKGDEFDEIRKIRNSVNYYGETLTAEEARGIIQNIRKLRNFIAALQEK